MLFPRFESDGPYLAIKNQMVHELQDNIEHYSRPNMRVYDAATYETILKDFTIALVRIARMDRDWYRK